MARLLRLIARRLLLGCLRILPSIEIGIQPATAWRVRRIVATGCLRSGIVHKAQMPFHKIIHFILRCLTNEL